MLFMDVPKLQFLCSRLCCRDPGSNGPNDKHSLEEQPVHLAPATATEAPVPLARLGWLPKQAKPSLHGGRRRTWSRCGWPRNVKSTMRKADMTEMSWETALRAPNPLPTGCLGQIKSNFNPGPLRASIRRKWPWPLDKSTIKNYHGNHSNPHIGNAIAWLHAPTTLPFDVWRLRAEAFALSIEHASTIYKLPASGSQDLIDRPWVSRCTDQSL